MNQDQSSSRLSSDFYFIYLRDVDPEETILHHVVKMRDINAVEQILELFDPSFINSLDGKSRSPVHVAIEDELESIVQLFLSTLKDSMAEDQCYLHFAIAKGNINIVKLLAEHFSVLTKNQENMTAFCVAINEDKFEILDYLLSLPSSINMNSSIYEHCALFYVAVIAGNIEIVKTYLESKFPIDAPLQSSADGWEILNQYAGFSPLHLAVKFLRLNLVELLLDQGADIMKPNGVGSSALQIAFETKTRGIWKTCQDIEINDQIIDRLLNDIIQKEALILTKSIKMSLLYAACSRDKPEMIEKCLQKRYITKKYLEKCDNLRFSPLHYAAKYSCHKVAKILLQYRVNVNQKDDKYRTPLHVASEERSTEFIQLLMQYNSDPNLTDFYGNTPIHLAFNTRNYAILDLLLTNETTVNPNVTDPAGISHFHIACTRNNVKLVRAFIDAGTPVDLQVPIDLTIEYLVLRRNKDLDWRGCVPLHFAIAFNRVKIVKLLLQRGADLRRQDAKGFYPIHTACQQSYTKIEELIMDSWLKYKKDCSDENVGWMPVLWKDQPHSDVTHVDGTKNEATDSYPRKFPSISSQIDLFKTETMEIIDWTPNRIEQTDIIKMLLKKGADLNVLDNFGNAPLYYICDFDIHKMIHILGKTFRLDKKLGTAIVRTLLLEMYNRRTFFLDLIFRRVVFINVDKSYNNTSILHYICQKNEFVDMKSSLMVKYFLKRNADPDATDRLKRTALHVALESVDSHEFLEKCNRFTKGDKVKPSSQLSCENKSYFEIIDVLLRYNARVDFRDGEGQTPLMLACLSKNVMTVVQLLDYGADVNMKINKNNDLQTALYHFYKQHVKQLARSGTKNRDVLIMTKLLVKHVKILQAVGLHVDEEVENPTLQMSRYLATIERHDDSAFTASLQIQVKKLKNFEIYDKISLYEVLFMGEQDVAKYGLIEQLEKILSSKGSCMDALPDYKELIEHKYKVAVERKRLLSQAKKTLNRILSLNFPEVCSEIIFMKLKNFEIAYFVKAFWIYKKQ